MSVVEVVFLHTPLPTHISWVGSPKETVLTQDEVVGLKPEFINNAKSANNGYGIDNPDAISPKGEGETFYGEIGKSVDIQNRNQMLALNRYDANSGYGITSKDALSDGDNFGMGENPDTLQVGTKDDILTRNKLMSSNRYNINNGYGLASPDAISDGDNFGMGENPDTFQVGTQQDIQNRINTIARNKYGEKKNYPDF